MLSELVTGHPPFPGDDLTAVISQHIGTRPVTPGSVRTEGPLGRVASSG